MAPPIIVGAAMVATAVGAGITAYGQYQQGQAASRMDQWKATNDLTAARLAKENAALDIEAGGVRRLMLGYQGAANERRVLARAAAGNVSLTQGSTAQVEASSIAVARANQDAATYDAAHAAWGEEIKAASLTSEASGELISAKNAVAAGDIMAAGTLVGAAGSVAGKWVQGSTSGLFGSSSTGGPLDINAPSPLSYGTLPAPTQQAASSWDWTG